MTEALRHGMSNLPSAFGAELKRWRTERGDVPI
jgi:hypothetical protein